MDLKLTQKEVAERIGVDKTTIQFWENIRVKPSLRFLPRIIEFLGNNPLETTPASLGEEIAAFRKHHGLSQRKLAYFVGIDPATIGAWEKGENRPMKRNLEKLVSILSTDSSFPNHDI